MCGVHKKDSVEQWENQPNECVQYNCSNTTGFYVTRCEDINQTAQCIDGECRKIEDLEDEPFTVVLDVDETTSFTPDNITNQLKEKTGIDDITIVVEYDDKGSVTRIVVYVSDKDTAHTILKEISSCATTPS